MKRPSSRVHLFRLEAVRKGGVSDTLGVYSLQSAGKPGDPPPLLSFPPDHPINSSTYAGFRKHLQSKEVPSSVRPVLEKHFDRFPDEFPGLPPHRKIECEIKLEAGHSPPTRAPYRLSYGQLDELRQQLDSYLEKGHIRPSTSPYAAPVLFVQKADGTQRMCIDFTGLNKITVRDKFPIPHPEELLSRLHGAKFFSSLDLRQYFHQTRIREGDEEKMAFRLPVRPRPLPEAVPVSVQPVGSLGAEYADLPDLVPEIEESQTPVRKGDGQQSRMGMELQSLTVSATQSQAFLDACRRRYSADPFFHPVLQHLSR
uniref:Reverse transcriptase domain-containing protein n=1 Tax=Chromera velia CCMP2878 TaxID=1169474 RepID=A0A0G4FLM1_9ALVE|eukprot:Cvel_403.t1-p1 / transcript=Cvel_403.t1 / gene=Cvel_403 / organism=Chromera_velia_CCMP2878 / gene_product=Transposon Ty3-I Gag-Pol polyprotein, putative / transcript_product=Transposon Ty3-I Gag-Pol polyprotein, putative / location=Cvel_scaffold13:40605-41745(+) / protein_length=312 / sequence_SO=supercontig / SO=protein_coding / is_pseudo=false